MHEEFIPIVMFAIIPLIVWVVSHYRTKAREIMSNSLRTLAEQGQVIDASLIKSLGLAQKSPHADLRTGLISIAIGIGFVIIGSQIPDEDGASIMASIASIPILVGAALVAIWFFTGRKKPLD